MRGGNNESRNENLVYALYFVGIVFATLVSTIFFVVVMSLLWRIVSATLKNKYERWKYEKRMTHSYGPQRDIGVGCPVLFTDERDFRGNFVCLHLGKYKRNPFEGRVQMWRDRASVSEEDAFTKGIMSYKVRRGFQLRVYEGPGFTGTELLSIKGPKRFCTQNPSKSLPNPGSVWVSIQHDPPPYRSTIITNSTPNPHLLREDDETDEKSNEQDSLKFGDGHFTKDGYM
jgi:hypothetical protein